MDVVRTPVKTPYISEEEYKKKMIELRAKAALKSKSLKELEEVNNQLERLTNLRNNSKSTENEYKSSFDIKI